MKPAPFELLFVTHSFRNVADQDYIAARALYRLDLDLQFLWQSLQALEKYLKAILLFNGRSARGIGHRLTKALKRVTDIDDIPFDFPPDLAEFLEYLEVYGQNRYLDRPHFMSGEELFQLDRSVWYIRRYCQYVRAEITNRAGKVVSVLPATIRRLQSPAVMERPTTYRIFGGFLEAVLNEKPSVRRSTLIWNNKYFGQPRKKHIGSFWCRSVSTNPLHFLEPQLFDTVQERVDFPRDVVEYFRRLKQPNKAVQPTIRREDGQATRG